MPSRIAYWFKAVCNALFPPDGDVEARDDAMRGVCVAGLGADLAATGLSVAKAWFPYWPRDCIDPAQDGFTILGFQ